MSSKVYRKYFGPADFRMMREILRRAGYIISDNSVNRSAHLNAAKLLVKEFHAGCSPAWMLSKLSKHHDESPPKIQKNDISSWENEGGAIRTNAPPTVLLSPRKKLGLWLLSQKSHDQS